VKTAEAAANHRYQLIGLRHKPLAPVGVDAASLLEL
jgi:hypothetical protein